MQRILFWCVILLFIDGGLCRANAQGQAVQPPSDSSDLGLVREQLNRFGLSTAVEGIPEGIASV
jgi:hypothetical protein